MTRRLRRPSPAFIVGCLALFVALGGPAHAKKLLVGGGNIKARAIASKHLRPEAVGSWHVRDRSLRLQDLTRGAVAQLEATTPGTVGELQLLDGAVTAPKLAPAAVTTGALALGAVTGPNIQAATIGTEHLGEGAVGSGKIRNGAVRKEDIGQQAVGVAELAGTSGSGAIPAGVVAAGDCAPGVDVAVSPAPAAEDTTGVLDDVVLGGRTKDWPATLALRVQPTAPGTVTAYACNTAQGLVTPTADLPFTVLTLTP